jgi:hypothetical protein
MRLAERSRGVVDRRVSSKVSESGTGQAAAVSAGRSGNSREAAYQLAFFTPGIRPRLARFRKQIRQIPNFR